MATTALKNIYSILKGTGVYRLGVEGMIDHELEAYDIGFEVVEAKLEKLRQNRFVATADAEGIARFEELVGLPVSKNLDLNARKRLVEHRLKLSAENFKPTDLHDNLKAAGIDAVVYDNVKSRKVDIVFKSLVDETMSFSQVEYYLNQILPAHLGYTFDYGGVDFDLLDGRDYSWDRWESLELSFEQFDQADEGI